MSKNRIPKIIHYVWVGGKEKPKDVTENIESWKKYCPDYEIKEWNEDNFDINSVPYVKQAYESKKFAFVADYIRLYAVYNEGGIYLDTDVLLYKNVDRFLSEEFFACFENMVAVSVSVYGAKKGNKIVKRLLDSYENRPFYLDEDKTKLDLTPNIILATVLFGAEYKVKLNGKTQTLKTEDGRLTLLSRDYFFPQDYISHETTLTENSYGVHQYYASWITNKQKKEDLFVERVRKIFGKRLFYHIEKLFLKIRYYRYKRKLKKYISKK